MTDCGCLPLHYAAGGNVTTPIVLQSLLKAGTEMNIGGINGGGGVLAKNCDGETPLVLACHDLEHHLEEYTWDEEEDGGNEDLLNLLWERVYILARATSAAFARRNNIFLSKAKKIYHCFMLLLKQNAMNRLSWRRCPIMIHTRRG